ncbi:periplasmic heavy metal sensor [uncultured Sneathiella sp.]|uniref:periplasmic heavy metal sensor n=1 Tax=uncultured Sneathiella sp. TaxID=879315 RepID=UPI0030DC853A|tara:strand:+ start:2010 stop:2489 length:480 start_codon:yes stop_codon:yes gene_type:complete
MRISRQKILSAALVLSVAVNLIIGGFLITQWIDHGGDKRRHGKFHFDRKEAVSILDEKEQEKFRQLWKDNRGSLRPFFREFRQHRETLAELFSAETLDLVAINQTYADMIATQIQIESFIQASMIELAKSLPEDKRAAFFEKGFEHREKWRNSKKGDEK